MEVFDAMDVGVAFFVSLDGTEVEPNFAADEEALAMAEVLELVEVGSSSATVGVATVGAKVELGAG